MALKPTTKIENFRNPLSEPLPNCHDAERALLGVLMIRNDLLTPVANVVKVGMFGEEVHNELFAAIKMHIEADKPTDPTTLRPYVGEADLNGQGVTPFQYLVGLAGAACTPQSAVGYAKEVQAFHARRSLILFANKAMHDAWNPSTTLGLNDLLRDFEDGVETLRPNLGVKRGGYRSMSIVADETYDQIQGEVNGDIVIKRLKTGYPKLDRKIGGLQSPDLIILAGRPASGKTALALDVALNVAGQLNEERSKDPSTNPGVVGIVSLEMGEKQIGERAFSRMAQVSGTKIRGRYLEKEQLEKLAEAKYTTRALPIEIDESGAQSVAQICAKARKLHKRKRLRLLVIDYLQLIQGNGSSNMIDQRNREIAVITGSLKNLAKELEIPVILLSQVGRQVDGRPNKRPNDSDLKDSGSIEQDADTILFVYREEAYVRKEQPPEGTEAFMEWEARLAQVVGKAEIIVGKNRFGSQGMVLLGYDGPHTTFLNDPPSRVVSPDLVRENNRKREKRGIKLPADAAILLATIEGMMNAKGRRPTDEELQWERNEKGRELPHYLRVVSRDEVFKTWAGDRLPGETEAKQRSTFTSLMEKLREANKTALMGSKERGAYLWLPEKVAT